MKLIVNYRLLHVANFRQAPRTGGVARDFIRHHEYQLEPSSIFQEVDTGYQFELSRLSVEPDAMDRTNLVRFQVSVSTW